MHRPSHEDHSRHPGQDEEEEKEEGKLEKPQQQQGGPPPLPPSPSAASDDDGTSESAATEAMVVEAAAQELEARLAFLRQSSNWRLNTRQYPSSPALESQHALWVRFFACHRSIPLHPNPPTPSICQALRQTASGGLSLVLPATVEEAELGEHEDFRFHRGTCDLGLAPFIHPFIHSFNHSSTFPPNASISFVSSQCIHPPLPPNPPTHAGKSLSSAVDEIQALMSSRASRAWTRSATMAASEGALGGGDSRGRTGSVPSLPLPFPPKRSRVSSLGPGMEGGGRGGEEEEYPAAALASMQHRDSYFLRTSLLSSRSKGTPGKVWSTGQRLLWTAGDYLMSLLVFVSLSVTWWR